MNSQLLEKKNNNIEKNLYDFGSCVDQITNDDQKFVIKVNISSFTPDEITVNIINDTIVIEGFHKEKEDEYGTIQRHFIRKYSLPNNIDKKTFVTSFQNGILNIDSKKLSK
uniref:SHSP domain-containing protein n=1 Tax=Strongyloides stercoralis TaxID=6248 RepID=A0A0K0DXW1_STRER